MNKALQSRLPALLCVLLLLLCAIAVYPVAEMGMVDDFSYLKSAEVLAQTGHIVYNGWATAMLGWQLYLGALFLRLFGDSFTAARASTLLAGLLTAFLTQRTLVRAGIDPRNATIGTLALVLSPLYLPLAVSFMTDTGGLFCIVLCLYGCLRSLQAKTQRATLLWLAFAALSNALGGTIRQIAWLGALVMIPCVVWLLRRRPRALVLGVLLYSVSGIFIFASLRWFQHQPYSIPEPLIPGQMHRNNLNLLAGSSVGMFLDLAMFLLPILIAFWWGLSRRNWRVELGVVGVGALLCAGAAYVLHRRHRLEDFLAPFKGNWVTAHGFIDYSTLQGSRPVILTSGIRLLLTATTLLALLGFLAFLLAGLRRTVTALQDPMVDHISWPDLLVLVGPFTLAYLVLLGPRAAFGGLADRYLLPLLLVAILLLVRLFQDRVQHRLPLACGVAIALFAAYGVAGTHDAFSMFRARQAAVEELLAAGVPKTSIDAGFESNSMTQIDTFGTLNDPRIRVPANAYQPRPSRFPADCAPQQQELDPVLSPGYTLSYDPAACGGLAAFPPVEYHDWLGAHTVSLYIVKTIKPTAK